VSVLLYGWLKPDSRKMLRTHVNSMDTMLLGGLWHGASWNFMIWGGLNGIGQIVYKIWTKWSRPVQTVFICALCALMYGLSRWTPAPVWNLFFVWTLVLAAGTLVRLVYYLVIPREAKESSATKWISNAWAVFQTFVFITFTRLFFRSGSNLDPALANEEAWNTAKNMVTQIGSAWDLSIVPRVAWQHRSVLIVFAIGMLIHWIPEKAKRRYRIRFATLPLPLMAVLVFLAVFFVYQFITADLQSFIYFQF
jgi:D-alanyl-lipoteichoic acid acyltransferase DltB (MBOAT superfamily)